MRTTFFSDSAVSPYNNPLGHRSPWTDIPLDRDPPLDRVPLDRDPPGTETLLDRDPTGQRFPRRNMGPGTPRRNMGPGSQAGSGLIQRPSPPVHRMTDTCKNITLPQPSFVAGKKNYACYSLKCDGIIGSVGFRFGIPFTVLTPLITAASLAHALLTS